MQRALFRHDDSQSIVRVQLIIFEFKSGFPHEIFDRGKNAVIFPEFMQSVIEFAIRAP